MLRLHVFQAEFGDCLMLEYGTAAKPKYLLIDGGPSGTYEKHLQPVLKQTFPRKGRVELVMLSHVDNDHVTGLLDLFADLRQARDAGKKNGLTVGGLWHNAFSQTIDPKEEIHPRLRDLLAAAKSAGMSMAATEFTLEGILEGHQLRLAALALGVSLNPGFAEGVIRAETAPQDIRMDGLSLRVVGPTQKNLENLRKKWLKWLEKNEARLQIATQAAAVKADTSIPNLSSIMVLVEESGKKLLLTGDGRGSDLLQGLKQAKLLDAQGRLHVDVLKMPHHGSARNITQKFLETVTADRYVISANGMYGNPDFDTLRWLVEAARAQGRKIEILMTNETPSSRETAQGLRPAYLRVYPHLHAREGQRNGGGDRHDLDTDLNADFHGPSKRSQYEPFSMACDRNNLPEVSWRWMYNPLVTHPQPSLSPSLPQTASFRRTQATWLAYLLLSFYAFMAAMFGPLLPFLRAELNMSYTLGGLHLSALATGIILAGLSANRISGRRGRSLHPAPGRNGRDGRGAPAGPGQAGVGDPGRHPADRAERGAGAGDGPGDPLQPARRAAGGGADRGQHRGRAERNAGPAVGGRLPGAGLGLAAGTLAGRGAAPGPGAVHPAAGHP